MHVAGQKLWAALHIMIQQFYGGKGPQCHRRCPQISRIVQTNNVWSLLLDEFFVSRQLAEHFILPLGCLLTVICASAVLQSVLLVPVLPRRAVYRKSCGLEAFEPPQMHDPVGILRRELDRWIQHLEKSMLAQSKVLYLPKIPDDHPN
jgi:hypothetical protein